MAILRFRIYWEEDDLTYRDIELQAQQSFLDFHQVIIKAFEFDGKHSGTFYVSDDKWNYGRALDSEVLTNKKDAPALSMVKTPVSALIALPDQKFIYTYNQEKKWTFLVELTNVSKDETFKRVYPFVLRKEGISPSQYGVKGAGPNKLLEVVEQYDLGEDSLNDGYGDEGEEDASSEGEEDTSADEQSVDF